MVEKLEALNLGDDGRVLIDLLNSTRAESVSGYQMCRSMLLQASIISGEYTAEAKHVELTVILNELGLLNHPRATVRMKPPEGLRVLTDQALSGAPARWSTTVPRSTPHRPRSPPLPTSWER